MLKTASRIVVALLSAAVLFTLSLVVGVPSATAVATNTAPSVTAQSDAPTIRKTKKTRCVVVSKRTSKHKRIKKCKTVVTTKKKRCVTVKRYVGKKVTQSKTCKKTAKKKTAKKKTLKATGGLIPSPTSRPASGQWPSAQNSGVPAGKSLSVHKGDLTVTTPGAVIDGLDIRGFVVVKAPNVTIKRSIIRGGPAGSVGRGVLAITHSSASNYLVEDVTIAPSNPTPHLNGINVNQAGTIRRADISGTVDGIMIYGGGVRVESSYLHDFRHYTNDPNWGGGPSHDDAIQVQGGNGIQIVGNTLTGAYNSAVMVTQDAGATKNLSINGNWLDYGGCSINYGSNGAYKTGMKANGNSFGQAQRNNGCAIIHNAAKSDLAPTGNVWETSGGPATVKRGG